MDREVRSQIEAFIKPESVAVIGASERMGSWGSFIMEGLLNWKYPGKIYPVNPNVSTVYGLRAYPDMVSVPDRVDLAVIAIPAPSVLDTIRSCAEREVKGLTIITAGFGEALEEGKAQELELARVARSHGMRILGPNVSGTFNLHSQFNASASPSQFLFPTPLTAVCQGGYAIYDLLAGNYWRRMGVGQFIHTGNECDLEIADFVEYFSDDPYTGAIVMYIETIRNMDKFRGVMSRAARKKPIIVHKVGRTPGGRRAARSHTGAIAGVPELYRALFRQLNIVQCPAMELLLPLGHAFLELPPMEGNRVAILTMGGSWGVALTDMLEEEGILVPELSPPIQKRLKEMGMPLRASTRNPIDIGAAGDLAFSVEKVVEIAEVVLQSDEVDGIILHGFGRLGLHSEDSPSGSQIMMEMEKEVMKGIYKLMDRYKRPIIIGSFLLPSQSKAIYDLTREGYRIFHQLQEIVHILSLKFEHHRRVEQM